MQVSYAAPVHRLPISTTKPYLDLRDESATKAARLLGALFINVTTLMKEVFSSTSFSVNLTPGCVDKIDIDAVGVDILQNFYEYRREDASIVAVLSDIPFVRSVGGGRAKPTDLFDPEVDEIKRIIGGDSPGMFPDGDHASGESLAILRHLGIKAADAITGDRCCRIFLFTLL